MENNNGSRGEYTKSKIAKMYEMAHCGVETCKLWKECFRGAYLNAYLEEYLEAHDLPPRKGVQPKPIDEQCLWFVDEKEIKRLLNNKKED